MAFRNKKIINPKAGVEYHFIRTAKDTGGKLLEMEVAYRAHSIEPAPHYHPRQVEDFTLLKGEMNVRIGGELRVLKQGDTLHIPRDEVHSMWNNSDETAVVNWKIQPALDSEYFFETTAGLAHDGKTDEAGVPGILQASLLMNRFSAEFRLAKPPYWLLKIVFLILAPIAKMRGYKSAYPEYLN